MSRRPDSQVEDLIPHFDTMLVDSSGLLRDGLSLVLSRSPFRVVYCSATLERSGLERLAGLSPRLLIIGGNGDLGRTADQIRLFKGLNESGSAAVLTEDGSLRVDDAARLFDAGANALLSKTLTATVLVAALEMLMLGQSVISKPFLPLLLNSDPELRNLRPTALWGSTPRDDAKEIVPAPGTPAPPLSAKQQAILQCLAKAETNKEIARKLNMTEATLYVHLHRIYGKLRLRNRAAVVNWALENLEDLESDGAHTVH